MSPKTRTIQLDAETADALAQRAAERGVTVVELVSELVPVAADPDDLLELEGRWEKVRTGEKTVPHDEVRQWLETWGTDRFKPFSDR